MKQYVTVDFPEFNRYMWKGDKMKLPKRCQHCNAILEECPPNIRGIQYCSGALLEEDGAVAVIDLKGCRDTWEVEPYEAVCNVCDKVIWKGSIKI